MREFKTYHPIVNFIYFVFVIGFSCFLMHPLSLFISLFCALLYSVLLKGAKAIKTNLIYMIPMLLVMAVINPVFNHQGMIILSYFPNGNPLTLESIVYGICTALMIASVICHFSCYNEIMTSDKFIYLFGKIIPSLSLVISMTLRFVPKFSEQFKVVKNARKCMGYDLSKGSIIKRLKNAFSILSIMLTWALENAIETADSMKSRGYGHPGRTAYSIYNFDKRDKLALLVIVLLGAYTLIGSLFKGMEFSFFPTFSFNAPSLFGITTFVSYFILCLTPVIIELWEVKKWKSLRSRI